MTGVLNSNGDAIGCYDHVHSNFVDDDLKDIDAEGRCIITLHKVKVLWVFQHYFSYTL